MVDLQGTWLPGVEGAPPLLLAGREVARYLAEATAATFPSHRLQHLEQATKGLDALANQRLQERSPLADASPAVLAAWRAVLDDLRATATAAAAHQLPNPFRAGNPLTPEEGREVFRGREAFVRQIEALLADPQQRCSLALLGPRRCGKTSLLRMLPGLLPDTVCVFFDLQDNPVDSPAVFWRALAQHAREQVHRDRRLILPALPEGAPFEAASQWLQHLADLPGGQRILLKFPPWRPRASAGGGHGGACDSRQGVGIAIGSPQPRAMLLMHTGLLAMDDQVKPPARLHDDAASPGAGILPCSHDRFDHIPGLHPEVPLLARPMPCGEGMGLRAAHLPCPMPHRPNAQRLDTGHVKPLWCACPNTGCVAPVRLGDAQTRAVVLGTATGTRLDWDPSGLQGTIECPARRVDGGGVFQRHPGLCLDLRKAKLCRCLSAFLRVTGATGQGKIRHTVTSAAYLRHDRLYLKRHVFDATVGTGAVPFL